MRCRVELRNSSLLSIALLLGGLAGWYVGRLIGLNGDEWFSEPESKFEILAAACGILCGALFSYTSNKEILPRMVGFFIGGAFVLTMIGYAHFSTDMPSYKFETAVYLRDFVLQTLGIWLSPIIGGATISLLRVILR
ncbi:hypothetical protein ACA097_19490 [Pseudomonas sp. QL9]|uniref:hypothetical protein n=1 Tax=Pseudomonas sp. QL9 TaxID=3242725 RepID=UPI00352A90BD